MTTLTFVLLSATFAALAGLLAWMAILVKRAIGAWLRQKFSELLNGIAESYP